MESKTLTLSTSKNDEYGYGLAYRLACEQLTQIEDIEQQCRKIGAQYIASQKAITIEYLNQSYLITLPDVEISLVGKEMEVPLRDKILILHYLTQTKGTSLANKMISFKELPEGAGYFPTFYQRTIRPLVNYFGKEPHRLSAMARLLGGREADYGDAAVTINAFRQTPITLVLWKGDKEFAPEGNVLFDGSISDYLPVEDIIVLSETTVRILIKRLKTGGEYPA